jgi:hypothetical protein
MKKNTSLGRRNSKLRRKHLRDLIRTIRDIGPSFDALDSRIIRTAQTMAGFRVTGR